MEIVSSHFNAVETRRFDGDGVVVGMSKDALKQQIIVKKSGSLPIPYCMMFPKAALLESED
jgi:hypothetical protein